MLIQEYEKELKALNSHLTIRESPQAPDMAGIYYDDIFITGVPNKEIFDEKREGYVSAFGVPHKIRPVATAQVMQWLGNIEEELKIEKEFKESMKK